MQIILEIGSNWKTLSDCLRSIEKTKTCGADIVKFQFYTHKDLFGVDGALECKPQVKELSQYAQAIGLKFMCTSFNSQCYEEVDKYVDMHKIASSEITDLNILKKVNSFRKPVLLSTGGATQAEIETALEILKDCDTTLLHCVVSYPARIVDFRHVQLLKKFGKVGYSDHSIDVLNIPKLAKYFGCEYLEKHVNFTEHTDTPDASFALNEHEAKLMIDHINDRASVIDTMTGNPYKRKLVEDQYLRPIT